VVEGVRMVGSACPEAVAGCETKDQSAMREGAFSCAEVFETFFYRADAVADWPSELGELRRLTDSSPCADALIGVATPHTESWGCEPSAPPRIGAWPGEGCGLPLLAYNTVPAPECSASEPVDPDPSDPSATEPSNTASQSTGTERAESGCRSKSAAVWLVGLLPALGLRRCSRHSTPTDTP